VSLPPPRLPEPPQATSSLTRRQRFRARPRWQRIAAYLGGGCAALIGLSLAAAPLTETDDNERNELRTRTAAPPSETDPTPTVTSIARSETLPATAADVPASFNGTNTTNDTTHAAGRCRNARH
jgi:hypothetical protein